MLTEGILYYTDGELDPKLAGKVQKQIRKSKLPITAVSLKPISFGDKNIHLPLKRGVLSMAKQILAGLEAMDEDVVLFAEHDVHYPQSHWAFFPPDKDIIYYDVAVWKINMDEGYGVKVDDCRQLSGLCAYRDTLIKHYRKRVEKIEKEGWSVKIGHEPATHNRKERIDDLKSETWMSPTPLLDLRITGKNLTKSRWNKEEFRNKKFTEGWTKSEIIPVYGSVKRFIEKLNK